MKCLDAPVAPQFGMGSAQMTGLEEARTLPGGCGQNYLGRRTQVPDNSAGQHQTDGDQLSAAQHSTEHRAATWIIAQKFQKEPRYAVEENVGTENLAVKFFPVEHPGKKKKDTQLYG